MIRLAVAIVLSAAATWAQEDWSRLGQIEPGQKVKVLAGSDLVTGQYVSSTPTTLVLNKRTIGRDQVRWVQVGQRGGRLRRTLIGAATGFALGFVVGAAGAVTFSDNNNASRAAWGAGFGLYGAGIGAGIGAVAGNTRYVQVYEAPRR